MQRGNSYGDLEAPPELLLRRQAVTGYVGTEYAPPVQTYQSTPYQAPAGNQPLVELGGNTMARPETPAGQHYDPKAAEMKKREIDRTSNNLLLIAALVTIFLILQILYFNRKKIFTQPRKRRKQ